MLNKYVKNKKISFILEIIIIIIISLMVKRFVVSTAIVNGASMQPTLESGDRVIVNKIIYSISTPKQGDIILFPFKGNPEDIYIKRIIGTQGDIIDFIDEKFVVNGEFISNETILSGGDVSYPITLQVNEYFVLGDNRNASKDSRYNDVGIIHADCIIGKASIRFFPISSFGLVK